MICLHERSYYLKRVNEKGNHLVVFFCFQVERSVFSRPFIVVTFLKTTLLMAFEKTSISRWTIFFVCKGENSKSLPLLSYYYSIVFSRKFFHFTPFLMIFGCFQLFLQKPLHSSIQDSVRSV